MQDHDTRMATAKIFLAWLLAVVGGVTLSQLVLFSTLVFTVLQSYFLLRDKWWRERNKP